MATRNKDLFETMPKKIGYKCKLCPYHTTSLTVLNHHLIGHQSSRPKFNCENSSVEKYCCFECDFTSDLVIPYTQHVIEYHAYKLEVDYHSNFYICEKCKFETNFILKWFRHVIADCLPDEKKWFQCAECEYKTMKKKNLQWHTKSRHSIIEWIKCDHCDFQTTRRQYLQIHQSRKHLPHDEIQWFECDQCDYKTKTRDCLRKHIKRHSPKWLKCYLCDYKTIWKVNLKHHQTRKHLPLEEIRWFECDQCDYRGKIKINVQKHIRRRHPKVEWK